MRKERDRPNLGRRIDGQTTRPNDHRRSYHSALFGRLTHTPLSGANVGGNNIRVSNFVLEAATLYSSHLYLWKNIWPLLVSWPNT